MAFGLGLGVGAAIGMISLFVAVTDKLVRRRWKSGVGVVERFPMGYLGRLLRMFPTYGIVCVSRYSLGLGSSPWTGCRAARWAGQECPRC